MVEERSHPIQGESSVQSATAGPLHELTVEHITAIDEALRALGSFGEVRLIKNNGKLKFIQTVESKSFGSPDDRM